MGVPKVGRDLPSSRPTTMPKVKWVRRPHLVRGRKIAGEGGIHCYTVVKYALYHVRRGAKHEDGGSI